MGYTTSNTELLIGLGASAISDAKYAYAQNLKKVEDYLNSVTQTGLAGEKGHILSDLDIAIRQCILQISCKGELSEDLLEKVMDRSIRDALMEMENEGIIYLWNNGLKVTTAGEPFVRNICRVFDQRMDSGGTAVFSKAI